MTPPLPLLRSLAIAIFGLANFGLAAEPLHTVAEIRALSHEDSDRHLPVEVEGIAAFFGPWHSELLFHDGHDGIYVRVPQNLDGMPPLESHARIRIEGTTESGEFVPLIAATRVTFLGKGQMPEPHQVVEGELFSPALSCQWIEVPAVIVGAGVRQNIYTVTAEVAGRPVLLKLAQSENATKRVAQLMQRPVRIRGMAGTVFNLQRQLTGRFLFVDSFDDIIPSELGEPFAQAPLRSVDELLRFGETPQSRIRVQGVVTAAQSEGLYLRGKDGSVLVRWTGGGDVQPGFRVEAEGFADAAPFRPILRATQVTTLARQGTPPPVPLHLEANDLMRQQCELVSVDAEVLARRDAGIGPGILQCRVRNWVFDALLPEGLNLPPEPKANSIVRLCGICELTTTHSLPPESVDGFRLHLRTPADIVMLRTAPWWTFRRVASVFGLLAAVALAALAWVALLRRRVAEQTTIIAAQIQHATVNEERQRIARELHDTLEQDLAGTAAQLRTARRRLESSPDEADAAVALAERMLSHCREEARSSIRDLRSVALEQRGLSGALDEFLAPVAAECGARLQIEICGEPRPLPGAAGMHLLRIAHQATINAAQHAAPLEIAVRLAYEPENVILEICDNGRGFNPAAPAPRGHFGILGMRERANKLRAQFEITTAPGAGTAIRVITPLNGVSKKSPAA